MSTVLYLSGAPRLSTSPDTESLGPRSHILGVIGAFEASGVVVTPFIAGDQAPRVLGAEGSEARVAGSRPRVLAVDMARLLYRWKNQRRTRTMLRAGRPTFVYERYALFQDLGAAARRIGVPWVLEVNALLSVEATTTRRATSSRRVARYFEAKAVRGADLVVVVSEALRRDLIEEYGLVPSKVLVVPNGVDSERFAGVGPRVADEEVVIGFLGALYSWQAVDELVAYAVERRNVRLRIAGTGQESDALRSLVSDLGIEDRVEMLGKVHPDEVPEFLASCDLLYSGHRAASGDVYFSPLKLWEYLAAGRPVLASAHAATLALQSGKYAVRCFSAGSLSEEADRAIDELPELLRHAHTDRVRLWREHSWTVRVQPILDRFKGAER